MLSIIIPVFNEAESLPQLHEQLLDVARRQEYQLELIYVDDGSSDNSWSVIESLGGAGHSRSSAIKVRGIRFRRNFGKAAALNAGFSAAGGDFVFTMDADLQDDPEEIPRFLEKMEQNLDVVSGWKKVRHDPLHKVWPSRVFNWLVSQLTGVHLHDHNCGFKCYRREVFDEIHLYGELHRFVPVLAAARGWRVGEIIVHHRPRVHGASKYGFGRFIKGFLDLLTVYFLTGFRERPQHLLGTVGLLFFALGGFGLVALTAAWIATRLYYQDPAQYMHLHQRAIFYYSIVAVLLGAQFMSIGFLAEMLNAISARTTLSYSVRQTFGDGSSPSSEQADTEAKNIGA